MAELNLKEIFAGIELNEEQIKGLDKFFSDYKDKIYAEAVEKAKAQVPSVDLEKYVLIEDAEKAFDLFEKDCEKAFELFEEDAESAFDLFESHAEKAFELFEEDAGKAFDLFEEETKNQFTENMAKAIQEIYSDIEDRVKKDFMESKEYKTINALKSLVLPLLEDDENDLVAKIKQISEEKARVEEDNKELAKEKTIATLVQGLPSEYVKTVKNFISEGKDEDEVIKRFNTIVEVMEIKLSKKETVNEEEEEDQAKIKFTKKNKEDKTTAPITEEVEEQVEKEKKEAEHIFEYESVEIKGEQQKPVSAFTEEERKMLELAGLPV